MTLKPEIHDVFVVGSARERAQIEQFTYTHENITHTHLGTLCGFWGITERAPEHDYIAHRLSAHARTAYFARHRKSAEANFAYTLAEINTLLAEHTEQHSTSLAGIFDGILCAYTDDRIYFSVTGNALLFLVRDGTLTELSRGAAPDPETQETDATFTDVISGQVHQGDKLILTGGELLTLVPRDELAKNATTMDNASFVQFITTVLTNECSVAATHIIDITETAANVATASDTKTSPNTSANAFSAESYKRPARYTGSSEHDTEVDTSPAGDYTDKRTGHIYVQGDHDTPDRSLISPLAEYTDDLTTSLSESASTLSRKVRASSRGVLSHVPRATTHLQQGTSTLTSKAEKYWAIFRERFSPGTEDAEAVESTDTITPDEQDVDTSTPTQAHTTQSATRTTPRHQKARILQIASAKKTRKPQSTKPAPEPPKATPVDLAKPEKRPVDRESKKKNIAEKDSTSASDVSEAHRTEDEDTIQYTSFAARATAFLATVGATLSTFSQSSGQMIRSSARRFHSWTARRVATLRQRVAKRAARDTTTPSAMPTKKTPQRTAAPAETRSTSPRFAHLTTPFLAGILLVLVAYMIWWTTQRPGDTVDTTTQTEESPAPVITETTDTALVTDDDAQDTLPDPVILTDAHGDDIVRARGATYIIDTDAIVTLTGSRARAHTLPTGAGAIAHSTYTPETHTFYLITTTNALYAFDPRGGTFTKQTIAQTISFDDISALAMRGTDLLIVGRDMITAHPRESRGFAAGTDLLSQERVLIDTHALLTQDDALYILSETGLIYVSDGNTIAIDSLQSATRAGQIDTAGNLWVLDSSSATLLYVERDTFRIIDTYTHPLLAGARAIARDGDKVYATTGDNTLSFTIPSE